LEFEGEYLNDKKNGKGKEYNTQKNELIYEGEYLNDKKNGKGKEYNLKNELIFEGEYLNGKRWNGKAYDKNGSVVYELKDGKGKIKEYNNKYGYLEFEGELINGEINGKGKEYNFKGIIKYEGEYLNGKRNGKGKEYNDNGNLIFEGEYKNGNKWKRIIKDKNYLYHYYYYYSSITNSKYINGEMYSKTEIYEKYKGISYEGEYLNWEKHGKGKEMDKYCNIIFEGEYKKGKRWNGKGIEYVGKDNSLVKIEYKNGEKIYL
jgi:antitoxin component YwqK of YwqJK toxin-antitoxin module